MNEPPPLVFAGRYDTFTNWLHENGHGPNDYRYASQPSDVAGRDRNRTDHVLLEGFWRNPAYIWAVEAGYFRQHKL